MTYQPNIYTGNGTNQLFTVSFPYLSESDVVVTIDNVVQTLDTDYVFLSSSQIEITVAPGDGVEVRIERVTNRDNINAVLQSGSAIPAADLNDNFQQTLFIAQEVIYQSAEAIEIAAAAETAEANSAQALATANSIAATAASALSTANAAAATANAAQTTANGIAGVANSALSNSLTASSNATAALATANGIAGTANTALTNANTAISTADTANTNATAALAGSVPAGAVMFVAMNSAPAGWLRANGAAVSRSTYATLFAAIGTLYGPGDGSTTFNLPDLRGLFPRSFDDGRGVDPGRSFGTYQGSSNLWHGHAVSDAGHAHGVFDPGHAHNIPLTMCTRDGTANNIYGNHITTVNQGIGPVNFTTSGSGIGIGIYGSGTGISIFGDGGSESRPHNLSLLAIIKF